MTIHPTILNCFPCLNDAQRSVIGHMTGPLLVVAGPGSGKTFSIILQTLNLLVLEQATPSEVILCTFTEKAAFEMRDRIAAAAKKIGYNEDLSELTVSTIHGLCNHLLQRYRHRTPIGHNYEVLDELTQLLFLSEHFDEIVGQNLNDLYFGCWKSR
ncbi:UvrD-helicase domain-containing protein [Methylacidiphilum caldifontis]|nr:UvrD-helicase domain-containing protein [Methylacidiphilum caldifontis]